MVGQVVSHYRIVEKLGGGGMGVVYEAEDPRLGRHVAVKFLPEELLSNPEAVERFQREARAASALNHPNICTVYDVGEDNGRHFMVMELLRGRTLRSLLEGGALPTEQLLELGIHAADALEAAHKAGIVHRDIKPANLFITQRQQIKVLDFGLAKLSPADPAPVDPANRETAPADAAGLTSPGVRMGTLAYMSPEQARGEELDARTDLFSFGLVLYEMATGRQAFEGSNNAEILAKILRDSPPPPRSLNPKVPIRLEELILKALEKDRKLRYQTASDLKADLSRMRRDSSENPVRALPQDTQPPSGRRSWHAGIGLAALVVIAVALAFKFGIPSGHHAASAGQTPIRSLAVLPLENLSGDPQQEYFADGMTEELITELSKISALRVISRTSAMSYKGSKKPLPEIARDLKVDAVVEGAVEKSGDRVRINAQLIDGSTDRNLWAESYERDSKDVLDLQSEVAEAIAKKIQVQITPQEQQRLAVAERINPEAHDAYELGQFHLNKGTEPELRKAIDYFNQAIQKQPDYPLAYLGIASSYTDMTPTYLAPSETAPKAREAILKALELDPNLAEGHAMLGGIYLSYDWEWPAAEKEMKKALELNANSISAREELSAYDATVGKGEDAAQEMKAAQALDPLSIGTFAFADRAWILYMAHDYNLTVEQCRKDLEISPQWGWPHSVLGLVELERGESQQALAEARKGAELDTSPFNQEMLGVVEAKLGMRNDALAIIDTLKKRAKNEYVCLYELGAVYAALGDNKMAFEYLDKAYKDRDMCIPWLEADPRLVSLHSDSRYRDLARKVGFPLSAPVI